jgi:hypothetical protein
VTGGARLGEQRAGRTGDGCHACRGGWRSLAGEQETTGGGGWPGRARSRRRQGGRAAGCAVAYEQQAGAGRASSRGGWADLRAAGADRRLLAVGGWKMGDGQRRVHASLAYKG